MGLGVVRITQVEYTGGEGKSRMGRGEGAEGQRVEGREVRPEGNGYEDGWQVVGEWRGAAWLGMGAVWVVASGLWGGVS